MYERDDCMMCHWNPDDGEDYHATKKAILDMFRTQKVSVAKARYLFYDILRDIECLNPISTWMTLSEWWDKEAKWRK